MIQTFQIPGRLAGLNEIIGAINRHRFVGAKLKEEETARCALYALPLRPIRTAVRLTISWVEPNLRRDIDNVAAGVKFILDGLVRAGKLPNDGRRWVKSITHQFPEPDKKNPRVEVLVSGLEEEMARMEGKV